MAWNTTKYDDDPILPSDWNDLVAYLQNAAVPHTETFTGADATGTNPNKVLTLSNTDTTLSAGFLVVRNGTILHPPADYTVNHLSTNSTITFTFDIYDDDSFIVIYFTSI